MAECKTVRAPLSDTFKSENDTYKMLLLGITGSGKTSFANLLYNYFKLRDHNFGVDDVKCYFEHTNSMMSDTRKCTPWLVDTLGTKVTIIDTPGFNDTRGAEQSETNLKQLVSFLESQKFVHCICLVINGAQNRFDDSFKSAIAEITSILPKEVKKNTVTIFTHSDGEYDVSFDTKVLRRELGIDTPKFFINNPYCPLMKAKLEVENHSFNTKESVIKLTQTFDKLDQLFEKVRSFEKVCTKCFGDLWKVTEKIGVKFIQYRVLQENKARIEKKIKSLEQQIRDVISTEKKLESHPKYMKIDMIPSLKCNTLCGAPHCYSNCHAPCIFTGIIFNNVKECKSFESNGHCKMCSHHYTEHRHCKYTYKEEEVLLSKSIKANLDVAKTKKESDRILQAEQEKQLYELKFLEMERKFRIDLVILMAEFQTLSSCCSYQKIIDFEMKKVNSELICSLNMSPEDLLEVLGLDKLRQELVEIQHLPFTADMSNKEKHIWASTILDIDPKDQLDRAVIDQSRRDAARLHRDVIKEGNENVQKNFNHARDILIKELNGH